MRVSSKVECDLPDWNYQPFSELDLDELTHINIAFCNPDENGRLYCYIPDDKLKSIVSEANSHDVEVFAALGGGGGCDGYLQHIDTPEERAKFNANTMDCCETYDFDGIDLDIELGSNHQILQRWLLAAPDAELANWQAGDLCEDNRLDVFYLCLMRRMLEE